MDIKTWIKKEHKGRCPHCNTDLFKSIRLGSKIHVNHKLVNNEFVPVEDSGLSTENIEWNDLRVECGECYEKVDCDVDKINADNFGYL